MFGEEIYEGLADLIASQFFGHSHSVRNEFWNYTNGEKITKSPEPVPDPGLGKLNALSYAATGS
jgi:hypothetical protein